MEKNGVSLHRTQLHDYIMSMITIENMDSREKQILLTTQRASAYISRIQLDFRANF